MPEKKKTVPAFTRPVGKYGPSKRNSLSSAHHQGIKVVKQSIYAYMYRQTDCTTVVLTLRRNSSFENYFENRST